MKSTERLINPKINIRLKLAALWTAVMFCYIYGDYFSFYVPNEMTDFVNGETLLDTPIKILASAIFLAIPASMIFLSLILRPKLSRLLNIIFGVIYTATMVLLGILSIDPWWMFYVFLAIVESILTFTIVWQAFKWPKETAAAS